MVIFAGFGLQKVFVMQAYLESPEIVPVYASPNSSVYQEYPAGELIDSTVPVSRHLGWDMFSGGPTPRETVRRLGVSLALILAGGLVLPTLGVVILTCFREYFIRCVIICGDVSLSALCLISHPFTPFYSYVNINEHSAASVGPIPIAVIGVIACVFAPGVNAPFAGV